MNGNRTRPTRRVSILIVAVFGATLFAPLGSVGVRAATDLAIGGTAVIADAQGDNVRLRDRPDPDAEILGRYPEGTEIEILDGPVAADDDSLWYHVAVDGHIGFIIAIYLVAPVADETLPEESEALASVTGSAVIVNTNGDGIRCRAAPNTDAEILYRFVEGDHVELTGDPVDGWQPVVCHEQNGYVSIDFIGVDRVETPSDDDLDGVGGPGIAEITSVGTGQISGTNGDGVRCRAKANTSAAVITVLPEGAEVPLSGSQSGSWQPVICAGQKGFVYASYIGTSGWDDDDDSGDDDGGSSSGFEPGESAVVAGTNGDGVRLRARADFSGAVITVVGEDQAVTVRSGSNGEWVAVTYRGSDGFIHVDYLVHSTGGTGGTGGGSRSDLGPGDHAMTTDRLRVRADPSFDGEVLAVAASGTVVVITGSTTDGFYPVDWDGLEGWMHADYLVWTDEPISAGNDVPGGNAGSNHGSADGQALVDYAMRYLGSDYVYATHGPDTFDCSGFTYWVALHVLGKNIGTGTWTQSTAGRPVAYGSLQPGDLVFFQNTYKWGLSHVGIYIGNNQFIHAENEDTGVKISSLTSPYYSTRWYGARRIV